ncbi:MAG: hypothetical protein AAF729_02900 [Pseudomonadota bacterium]
MNAVNQTLDIADRLREGIENGLFDAQATERAEAFISRLKSPVRVAVMGHRRSGKSSLVNVLAGAPILPDGLPLPTLQATHGDVEKTVCTYPNGTKKTFPTVVPADLVSGDPIYIEMVRPLNALRTVSLLEVVMDGTLQERAKALAWAAKRCDIALWCTSEFDAEERALWGSLPAGLKSHAFLVLTRADTLGDTDAIKARLAEVSSAAKNAFFQVRPIASNMALNAIKPDGRIDTDGFTRSGAKALVGDVLQKVKQGRQGVRDAAEAFFQPYSPTPEAETQPEATTEELAKPAVEPVATEPVAKEPVAKDVRKAPEDLDVRAADSAPSPTDDDFVFVSEKSKKPAKSKPLAPELRQSIQSVITYISDRGIELATDVRAGGDKAAPDVMAGLLDDAIWLTEFLSDPAFSNETAVDPIKNTAHDIADLIQLMEMEKSPAATIDAVCLVLQIKRDMRVLLAA